MTRCLLADDHPALIAAVSDFLTGEGFEIVGPEGNGQRAIELAAREQPELAVVDYRMPRVEGTELIRRLKEVSPGTRIAVYTGAADAALAAAAFEAGASAVVLKEAPLADLVRALEALQAGHSYLDPALDRSHDGAAKLTPRECEVLSLLAEGLSHQEIGDRLEIGAETVRTHVRKASDRLNASTRTQAVATALRLGLIA